jgi:hypothetical protein
MNKIAKTIENGKVTIPAGYRLLKRAEPLQPGDFFTTPARDDWEATQAPAGTMQNPMSMKKYIRAQV